MLRGAFGVIISILTIVAAGCGEGQPPAGAPKAADDDGAFSFLASLDYAALTHSFESLDEYRPSLIRRTSEERAANGRIVARLVTSYRPSRDGAEYVRAVDTRDGVFTRGFLAFIAGDDTLRAQPDATVGSFVPSVPAFAAAKTREQFRYVILPDTTIEGERARRVYVEARESPDRQPLRKATVAAAVSDSAVLHIRIERLFASLFYDEASRIEVELRRNTTGRLDPARLRVSSRVDVPFRVPREFVSLEEYSTR